MLDTSLALSIRRQSELLNIPRGKYYYKPRSENPLNLHLMDLIDRQYQRTPFYGVPRMTDYLIGLGYPINHKRVRRLYKIMDIRALGPNPYTSKSESMFCVFNTENLFCIEIFRLSKESILNLM